MADLEPVMQEFNAQQQSPFANSVKPDFWSQASTALQNPLLQQYISALGGSMGGPVAKGLDPVNQQNIKSQNYMKMLQNMLKGGAKVGMDAENTTIKMPTRNAETIMGVQGDESAGQAGGFGNDRSLASGGTSATPQPQSPTSIVGSVLGGGVNPTASPLGNFTSSDLAGLTPQDISSALTGKLAVEKVDQESINSVYDNLYKYAHAMSITDRPLDREYPIQVPGIGKVTESQFRALPEDIRSYSAYVSQSKAANPNDPVIPFSEFKTLNADTKSRYLDELMKDPDKFKAALKLAQAGAPRIGTPEKLDLQERSQQVKDIGYFKTQDFIGDIDKYMTSDDVENHLMRFGPKTSGNTKRLQEEAAIKIQFINRRIENLGKVVDIKVDGRTIVFKVNWNNGTTGEVRYAAD
jgi:uncharacterized short protein YbdD (DUF466 family)